MLRRALAMVVAVGCMSTSASCGGSDQVASSSTTLRLDQIDAAMDAVAKEIGDEAPLFEVNATPLVVNVFVATDLDGTPNADGLPDGVIHYVFSEKVGLETAPEAVAATGPTFERSAIDFESDSILNKVTAELPDSSPQMFVMTAAGTAQDPTGVVEYRLLMQSPQGGQMSIVLTNRGEIVGTDAT